MQDKVPISVVNQKGYVWSVDHVRQLREQHRICGMLLGTLPQVAQQNVFLGLPMQLLPEEVVLLVSQNLAYLIDDRHAHIPATPSQVTAKAEARQLDIQQQLQDASAKAEEKKVLIQQRYGDQIEKKRAERKAEQKSQKQDATGLLIEETEIPVPIASEKVKGSHQAESHIIKIAGSSAELDWYTPSTESNTLFHDLEAAKEAGIWSYPTTLLQRAKCAVFRDLWDKGNYMGGGLKFGGDFLVYPGDPLRFHSHFSTTVLASPLASIQPLDLVAYGRLATGVKKAHLLCGYDERSGEVSYLSLEWAAMG